MLSKRSLNAPEDGWSMPSKPNSRVGDSVLPSRNAAGLPADAVTVTTAPIRLLLDRRAAAKTLCIGVSMLDSLVRRGEIIPVRIGRLPRFSLAELERFVREKQEAGQ